METNNQQEKTSDWRPELKRVLHFTGQLLLVNFLIALLFIVYPIAFRHEPVPDQILIRLLNVTGGVSILTSLLLLLLLLNPFQQSKVVTTAGRFRAPSQSRYQDDIIKRQVSDWPKSVAAALVLFLGFFLAVM
ncbi:MAG: hypothetical protein ACTSW1_01840 [Candidatus Hodarchaeales archaeon]